VLGWTRVVIRNRRKVLAAWAVLFLVGGFAASDLGHLLTNRFSVPGSDSERGRTIAKNAFGEHGDGDYTLVVQATSGSSRDPAFLAKAQAAVDRAARSIKGGKPGQLIQAGGNVVYAQVSTPLENQDASDQTPDVRKAIGTVPGAKTYLSGFPAVNHDTQPIYNDDLRKGETIAIPVALIVLIFMFGTLGGVMVPFVFAAVTVPTTLGIVWIFAHVTDMAIYVTNVVTLIGIAIAIDYSMLVVFRYREELAKSDDWEAALERTMVTAGRATLFSGMTVAIGLALLVFMPLPFMRSMGIGGLMVPLVSIAAAATFLPALLATMKRGVNRWRVIPQHILDARAEGRPGMWTRLANSIMRHPIPYLVGAAGLMLALAWPVTQITLTSGDNRGVPSGTEATDGLKLLEARIGAGSLAPHQVIVDTGRPGGAWTPEVVAAQRRFIAEVRRDPEVQPVSIQAPALAAQGGRQPDAATMAKLEQATLIDPRSSVIQMRVAGRTDVGTKQAKALVHRIREHYLPSAGFPASATVLLTGAPAFGVDFVDKAYGAFPWLILAVLVISYLLLLRAFRSLFLPLKAVLLNLLSVSATYGVLVLMFQHSAGEAIGLQSSPQIAAWVPIFLFAVLFGLSMDYEVFMLSRMREEWDKTGDNEHAVAYGLEHTGRIITAAAVIMVAAFSGFTAGSFVDLQQFGLGLSAAILLDATVVRALLVPAAMKLMGKWNWYLPERVRKLMRLRPIRPAAAAGTARSPARP
jgi:RND superfamily putative drug exporter